MIDPVLTPVFVVAVGQMGGSIQEHAARAALVELVRHWESCIDGAMTRADVVAVMEADAADAARDLVERVQALTRKCKAAL
jgi:hypothetical protein